MQNARLDEAQTGIKMAGRNINNLKYTDDTTLKAESEEQQHSLARSCSKSSKLGFNSTWTENFQIYKLDLEKTEEPEEIATIPWIIEKAREFQKNIYFCFIDYTKAFDCGSQQTVENS